MNIKKLITAGIMATVAVCARAGTETAGGYMWA